MIRVLELFGGIGACTAAIKKLGIDYEVVDYVEINKFAVKSYNAINGTNFEPQDIVDWDKNIKDVDLIMHGSPCQDFSIAGKQQGGDENSGTRSSLMYETIRIVNKLKPKYVVWENVKNLLSVKHRHNFETYLQTMSEMGYKNYYQVLNAKDYGIPQNRERVFCVSIVNGGEFQFPEKIKLEKLLKDVLENEVDEKYYLSEELTQRLQSQLKDKNAVCLDLCQWRREGTPREYNNVAPCLGARDYKEPRCVQVGNITGGKWDKMHDVSRRIYSGEGLAPTVHTCGGGNTEPKIVITGNINPCLEPNTKGLSNTLTTVQKDNLVIELQLRIRKLTPKECWRLMGFSDEDFEKAEKVNSNTQLYKQAGNSIVVDVLYYIFKNLLSEVYKFELLKG